MSQENVESAYRALEAFNRHDFEALLALVDPDVDFADLIVEVEGGGPFHGHEGFRSWWEGYLLIFPDLRLEIDELRDLGDLTLVHGRVHGRGTESEVSFEQTFWTLAHWRDQKIAWSRSFRSEAEALEAVELRE